MTKAKLTELDRVANDARLGEMRAIKELQEVRLRNVLMSAELDTARASEARLREALDYAYEGACRQLAEPRNHDNDQYALTAIATACEPALSGSSGEWLERHDAEIVARCQQTEAGEMHELRLRAEKADAERDGLAAFISSLQRSMSGSRGFVYVDGVVPGTFSDGPAISAQILATRDARIITEARRKALMDLGRRFKDYDGSDSLTVEEAVARIEDLAQEADHA